MASRLHDAVKNNRFFNAWPECQSLFAFLGPPFDWTAVRQLTDAFSLCVTGGSFPAGTRLNNGSSSSESLPIILNRYHSVFTISNFTHFYGPSARYLTSPQELQCKWTHHLTDMSGIYTKRFDNLDKLLQNCKNGQDVRFVRRGSSTAKPISPFRLNFL